MLTGFVIFISTKTTNKKKIVFHERVMIWMKNIMI